MMGSELKMPFSAKSRDTARADMSLHPGDGQLQVLTLLARARHTSAGNLPLAIVMRSPHLEGVRAQYGWGQPGSQGRRTNRPVAQLLIVPTQPPDSKAEVKFYFTNGQSDPIQKIESFTLDINGRLQIRWQAPDSSVGQHLLKVEVPLSVTRELSAYFITFTDFKVSRDAIDDDARRSSPGILLCEIMIQPIESGCSDG